MKLAQNPNISVITEIVLVSVAAGDWFGPGAEGVTMMFYFNVPAAEMLPIESVTFLSISVKKSNKHHIRPGASHHRLSGWGDNMANLFWPYVSDANSLCCNYTGRSFTS